MGGYGSGRQRSRRYARGCLRADVRTLAHGGALTPLRAGDTRAGVLTFARNGQHTGAVWWSVTLGQDGPACTLRAVLGGDVGQHPYANQTVRVLFTLCTFGGRRPWWECPWCGRRVAVVYLAAHGFGCRLCAHLAYESQSLTPYHRALDRRDAWRRNLGGQPGSAPLCPPKPLHQHWRTFQRNVQRLREAEQRADALFVLHSIGLLDRLTRMLSKKRRT